MFSSTPLTSRNPPCLVHPLPCLANLFGVATRPDPQMEGLTYSAITDKVKIWLHTLARTKGIVMEKSQQPLPLHSQLHNYEAVQVGGS